jgi:hypothetical protein
METEGGMKGGMKGGIEGGMDLLKRLWQKGFCSKKGGMGDFSINFEKLDVPTLTRLRFDTNEP